MTTTVFRPVLRLAIPADVTDHATARQLIERANHDLGECSCLTAERAIELAAIALSNSGASACAIPSYTREG